MNKLLNTTIIKINDFEIYFKIIDYFDYKFFTIKEYDNNEYEREDIFYSSNYDYFFTKTKGFALWEEYELTNNIKFVFKNGHKATIVFSTLKLEVSDSSLFLFIELVKKFYELHLK